jgi:hypothetical protein
MSSITIKLKVKVNANVTTIYNLLLDDKTHLAHGVWEINPPSTIIPKVPEVESIFKCKKRSLAMVGPEGTVYYKATDGNNNPTEFKIYFDVPYWKKENTVELTGGSEYYTLELAGDYQTGDDPEAVLTITQIGPTS